jgi:hypothetical protein
VCSWHLAMATDKVSSLSKTTRKRSDASVMVKTWKHTECLKFWSVKMIEKVRHYLTDILLLSYLVLTVYGGICDGNVLLLITGATSCIYTISQHKGQLFSDIIIWGMCLKSALTLHCEIKSLNAISCITSHLEGEDAEVCSFGTWQWQPTRYNR